MTLVRRTAIAVLLVTLANVLFALPSGDVSNPKTSNPGNDSKITGDNSTVGTSNSLNNTQNITGAPSNTNKNDEKVGSVQTSLTTLPPGHRGRENVLQQESNVEERNKAQNTQKTTTLEPLPPLSIQASTSKIKARKGANLNENDSFQSENNAGIDKTHVDNAKTLPNNTKTILNTDQKQVKNDDKTQSNNGETLSKNDTKDLNNEKKPSNKDNAAFNNDKIQLNDKNTTLNDDKTQLKNNEKTEENNNKAASKKDNNDKTQVKNDTTTSNNDKKQVNNEKINVDTHENNDKKIQDNSKQNVSKPNNINSNQANSDVNNTKPINTNNANGKLTNKTNVNGPNSTYKVTEDSDQKVTTLPVKLASNKSGGSMAIVAPNSTTAKPKKPTVTIGSEDEPENKLPSEKAEKTKLNSHETNTNFVVPIVAVILAVPLVAIVASVLYKRGTEWWQHRHYRRMDFLIDGMYNN